RRLALPSQSDLEPGTTLRDGDHPDGGKRQDRDHAGAIYAPPVWTCDRGRVPSAKLYGLCPGRSDLCLKVFLLDAQPHHQELRTADWFRVGSVPQRQDSGPRRFWYFRRSAASLRVNTQQHVFCSVAYNIGGNGLSCSGFSSFYG